VIIAVQLLGHMLGFTSERMWHRFVCENLFLHRPFPERSRYHRCCRQLLQVIKWIRSRLVRRYDHSSSYGIIDSMPLPLSHSARKYRAKRMKDIADIGYCASKQETYYGLKGSFQVTDDGFIVSYVISKASAHDVTLAEELIEQYPQEYIIADKGYISKSLKQRLKERLGVHLLVQPRANQNVSIPTSLGFLIRSKRKQIETLFSGLVDTFYIHRIRATSPIGFEWNIESILLAHTLLVHWAISRNGQGHRWKYCIFN
jgi:DDE family transposase